MSGNGPILAERVPAAGPTAHAVLRTWPDESQVLGAVEKVLPHVSAGVHGCAEAAPLSTTCENGKPVDSRMIQSLVGLLAQLAVLRREDLPRLPPEWPRDGHSRSFLRTLARLTDQQVVQPNWAECGGLIAALGIPENAMEAFAARLPPMVGRPFSLLHADLRRDRVMIGQGAASPVIHPDWKPATYGDPLHDLATHLVRMRYPDFQRQEVERAWYRAMLRIRPAAAKGLESDLRHYLDFENARAVCPEVVHAARSLGRDRRPSGLEAATLKVRRALVAASEPLGLAEVPCRAEIEGILYRWHAAHGAPAGKAPFEVPVASWVADRRCPENPLFPRRAVTEALAAEGAAPAQRVFRGTGHLNTVVDVPSIRSTVVVRRRLSAGSRREPRFLDEHVVLNALEGLRGTVRAPRVLAMGAGALSDSDWFVVHSYEGPPGGHRPPDHPVDGLLPQEADHVVDQLGALVGVDVTALDPTVGEGGFYPWLSERLVEMVAALPKESLQLARALGLPSAQRLKEILDRHGVTPRSPVLLHGDLNPWNLIRGEAAGEIVIVDWEMAMVGDPLYDLVRHLHLTPHRPEIRRRMLDRWNSALGRRGLAYVNGWEKDVQIYRWIENVRSAYVDLDRLVTGAGLEAPNVRRAVESYAMTLRAATASLGLRAPQVKNPYLVRTLPRAGVAP